VARFPKSPEERLSTPGGRKSDEAVECLTMDRDVSLAFCDFPSQAPEVRKY
jgi:hypothetical protein